MTNEQELREEISRLKRELENVSPSTFARRLRLARKSAGLNSQRMLAERVGIHLHLICGYENGRHEPSLKTLCKIADELHVSLDWLCGRVNENTFDKESPHETD